MMGGVFSIYDQGGFGTQVELTARLCPEAKKEKGMIKGVFAR